MKADGKVKSRVFLRGIIFDRKYSEAEHHTSETSRNRDFFSKFSLKSEITTINLTTYCNIIVIGKVRMHALHVVNLLVEHKYYLVLCMLYAFKRRFSPTAQYSWVRRKILELFVKIFNSSQIFRLTGTCSHLTRRKYDIDNP